MKMAELIGALSHALDMTEGQPPGHCIRACWIGIQIGTKLGLDNHSLWELYYTIMLKDLGCSSNAARICELYATDDLRFKHDFKLVDSSLTQVLNFVLDHTGVNSGLAERFKNVMSVLRHGGEWSTELMQTRCERGAEIAKQLRFSDIVSEGIRGLDEHWDGNGKPYGRATESIPLYSRIALISQVIDVFCISSGPNASLKELRKRRGQWFDPELVDIVHDIADEAFWQTLASETLEADVINLAPGLHQVELDDDYIDEIAAAFGQVVDTKSPFTAGHSNRVGLITDLLGQELGLDSEHRRWLKRGALLHDVGKLGVSNSILDKPGPLTDDEFETMKEHALFTGQILSRIDAFKGLADIAQAHHERLDGKGYPFGLTDKDITLDTRIITTADIFDAITADRPYRGAIPVPQALSIMHESVGTQLDPRCYDALVSLTEQYNLTEF